VSGKALIARALARLGLRRALVVVLETTSREAEAAASPLACTWLAPSAAAGLERLRPGLASEARERFAEGHRCWAASIDAQIASVRWVARGGGYVPLLRTDVGLRDDEALVYDTWTDPALRRRGVGSSAAASLASACAAEGVHRLVGVILPGNDAGLANALRAGYTLKGTIVSVGVGRHRLVRRLRSERTPDGAEGG
jgi:RimJ/RimL family protein N-acetyltransferase